MSSDVAVRRSPHLAWILAEAAGLALVMAFCGWCALRGSERREEEAAEAANRAMRNGGVEASRRAREKVQEEFGVDDYVRSGLAALRRPRFAMLDPWAVLLVILVPLLSFVQVLNLRRRA